MAHIEELILEFHNPYTDKDDILTITRPNYDFAQWMGFNRVFYEVEDIDIIKSKLKDLNCCKLFNDKPYRRPDNLMYKVMLAEIFYFMLRLKDEFMYNHIIDTLCTIHEMNLNFVRDYDLEHNISHEKPKRTRKTKSRAATIDMFTGERIIVEVNDRTGKVTTPKPKPKFTNVGTIPLSNMTFNFNKK